MTLDRERGIPVAERAAIAPTGLPSVSGIEMLHVTRHSRQWWLYKPPHGAGSDAC